MTAWALATAYCCVASYLTGYSKPGRILNLADVRPILGIPAWFFWSVLLPWLACGVFTLWYAGLHMVDDDLGTDHAAELESDIRKAGEHE